MYDFCMGCGGLGGLRLRKYMQQDWSNSIFLQPLATCMNTLQAEKLAIGLQISEPWLREYQVSLVFNLSNFWKSYWTDMQWPSAFFVCHCNWVVNWKASFGFFVKREWALFIQTPLTPPRFQWGMSNFITKTISDSVHTVPIKKLKSYTDVIFFEFFLLNQVSFRSY